MSKPILFHDIDGVLFGEYNGEFQLRPGVKTWLKWAHERYEIVWLTSWSQHKIKTLLNMWYSEKFLKAASSPPVQCANWTGYANKVEWLNQAIQKLNGREWYWIDEVKCFEREITELNLPKERCIHVSGEGAGALDELRDGLERLQYDEIEARLKGT